MDAGAPSLTDAEGAAFLALARHHRVASLVARHTEDGSAAGLPSAVCEALTRERHRSTLQMRRQIRECDRVVSALHDAGLLAVPLKGADLARCLYPEPGMRPAADIDILVEPARIARVDAILRSLGYAKPRLLLPLPLLRRFHFHAAYTNGERGVLVEIHWALADRFTLSPVAMGRCRTRIRKDGPRSARLTPPVYAAYLALHLSKHGVLTPAILQHERGKEILLHPFSEIRLIWMIDILLFMRRHDLLAADLLRCAEELGCPGAVRESLALCRLLAPEPFRTVDAPAWRPGRLERRVTRGLLRRILHDLDANGPCRTELPWILKTSKRFHVRPVRLLQRGVARA